MKIETINLKNLSQIAIGNIISLILSALLVYIITKEFGLVSYSIYATATALSISVVNLSFGWTGQYTIKYGVKQIIDRGHLGDTFFKSSLLSFLIVFILLSVVFSINYLGIIDLPISFTLLALLSISACLIQNLRCGLQTTQKYKLYGASLTLDKICILLAAIILLFVNRNISLFILVASSLIIFSATVSLYLFVNKNIKSSLNDFSIKEFSKFSLPFLISQISLYFASPAFVVILISQKVNLAEAGIVSIALSVCAVLIQPIVWIYNLTLPKFNEIILKNEQGKLSEYLSGIASPIYILYSLSLIALVPLFPYLEKLFDVDFSQTRLIFFIILTTYLADVIKNLISGILIARSKQKIIMQTSLLRSFLILVAVLTGSVSTLAILLILFLGMWISVIYEIWNIRDYLTRRQIISGCVIIAASLLPLLSHILFESSVFSLTNLLAILILIYYLYKIGHHTKAFKFLGIK